MDISRPGEDSVFLASCPGAAHKAQHVLFAGFFQTVIEALRVHQRVNIRALERGSGVITVIVEVVRTVLRLSFVQPEAAYTLAVIVLAALVPDEPAGFGICRVIKHGIAHPGHVQTAAPVCGYQHALVCHFSEILAPLVDCRPDRNHRFNSKGFQLPDHRLRVGPVAGFKLEIALARPVEEIHNDGVHGKPAPLVFTRHCQEFILSAVAQLALPVSQTEFRHSRRSSGCRGVVLGYLRRSVSGGYEVIKVTRRSCIPFRLVSAERRRSNRRIVPEETVAAAGNVKRNACLGIPVAKLQHGALLVQMAVLILTHAEYLLVVVCFKARGNFVIRTALARFQLPCNYTKRHAVAVYAVAVAPVFLGEHFSALVIE